MCTVIMKSLTFLLIVAVLDWDGWKTLATWNSYCKLLLFPNVEQLITNSSNKGVFITYFIYVYYKHYFGNFY